MKQLVRPPASQLVRLLARSAVRHVTPVRKPAKSAVRLAIRVRALAIRFARMLVNPLLRPVLFAKPYAIRGIRAARIRPYVRRIVNIHIRHAILARLVRAARPAIRVRIHAKRFARAARILARLVRATILATVVRLAANRARLMAIRLQIDILVLLMIMYTSEAIGQES